MPESPTSVSASLLFDVSVDPFLHPARYRTSRPAARPPFARPVGHVRFENVLALLEDSSELESATLLSEAGVAVLPRSGVVVLRGDVVVPAMFASAALPPSAATAEGEDSLESSSISGVATSAAVASPPVSRLSAELSVEAPLLADHPPTFEVSGAARPSLGAQVVELLADTLRELAAAAGEPPVPFNEAATVLVCVQEMCRLATQARARTDYLADVVGLCVVTMNEATGAGSTAELVEGARAMVSPEPLSSASPHAERTLHHDQVRRLTEELSRSSQLCERLEQDAAQAAMHTVSLESMLARANLANDAKRHEMGLLRREVEELTAANRASSNETREWRERYNHVCADHLAAVSAQRVQAKELQRTTAALAQASLDHATLHDAWAHSRESARRARRAAAAARAEAQLWRTETAAERKSAEMAVHYLKTVVSRVVATLADEVDPDKSRGALQAVRRLERKEEHGERLATADAPALFEAVAFIDDSVKELVAFYEQTFHARALLRLCTR